MGSKGPPIRTVTMFANPFIKGRPEPNESQQGTGICRRNDDCNGVVCSCFVTQERLWHVFATGYFGLPANS